MRQQQVDLQMQSRVNGIGCKVKPCPDCRLDLHGLLSEKGTYSSDVVQHVCTAAGCCSNVGSKGELTVECHIQLPCGLGGC